MFVRGHFGSRLERVSSDSWPAAMLNTSICFLHFFLIGTVCFHPQSPLCSYYFFFALSSSRLMPEALDPTPPRIIRVLNLNPRVVTALLTTLSLGRTKFGMRFARKWTTNSMASNSMLDKLSTLRLEN